MVQVVFFGVSSYYMHIQFMSTETPDSQTIFCRGDNFKLNKRSEMMIKGERDKYTVSCVYVG